MRLCPGNNVRVIMSGNNVRGIISGVYPGIISGGKCPRKMSRGKCSGKYSFSKISASLSISSLRYDPQQGRSPNCGDENLSTGYCDMGRTSCQADLVSGCVN